MPLDVLDKALEPIRNNLESYTFSKLIRACREAIGMKRIKASELAGMPMDGVQHMENGLFVRMIKDSYIEGISNLFGLPFSEVKNKVKEHVEKIEKRRKIKVNCEKYDEEEEIQFMLEREK